MANEVAALLLAELIDDDEAEEQDYLMMMAAARLAAQEIIEMEEGEVMDETHWQHVTVEIDDYHNMNDYCFRLHFRMSKATFQALVETIRNHLRLKGRLRRERTPLRNAVLMVLWLLATPDSFRSVALRFGVGPSTLYYHYQYIIEALRELADQFIVWPGPEERTTIKNTFRRVTGFPGTVGCIDCTHVYVTKPVEHPAHYKNRHHTYSYNIQAVADDSLLIRDLHVGEVGSMNDRRVLRRSPLFRELLQGDSRLSDGEHLLGDGGYTLTDFMLIPFANNGHLNERQKNYNKTLSQGRVRVENAFGGVKGKWRRIKHIHVRNQEIAIDHITACFVIHNFILLQGDPIIPEVQMERGPHGQVIPQEEVDEENPDDPDDPDDPEEEEEGDDLHELFTAAQMRGIEKRLFIMEHLGQFH